jgi:ATP-dependent DNA ligase
MSVDDWKGEGPLPDLYSRTATGAVNVWRCWVEGDEVCAQWGQLDGALQTSRIRCKPKNEGKTNETSAEKQAIKEARSKWKKQVKKKYSEKLDTAGETDRLKPMLAQEFHKQKHNLCYPEVYVQPKFDGVRCLAYRKNGAVYLQSRGGDPYKLPHIMEQLEKVLGTHVVLDGELYVHGMSLQSITSLVKRPREESKQVYYCIYDMFVPGESSGSSGGFRHRWRWVQSFFENQQVVFGGFLPYLWPSPTVSVSSEQHVISLQRDFVESGYEGAIIRDAAGPYRPGYRSPVLLKLKTWLTDEYLVIGWEPGRGKFENVPIFNLVTPQGKEFEATPKGTQEDRAEMLREAQSYLGKMMTVRFFDLTDSGAPKNAIAIVQRDKGEM